MGVDKGMFEIAWIGVDKSMFEKDFYLFCYYYFELLLLLLLLLFYFIPRVSNVF